MRAAAIQLNSTEDIERNLATADRSGGRSMILDPLDVVLAIAPDGR